MDITTPNTLSDYVVVNVDPVTGKRAEFYCSKFVLYTKSPVFKSLISEGTKSEFKLPEVQFQKILAMMHGEKLDVQTEDILGLLTTSSELKVEVDLYGTVIKAMDSNTLKVDEAIKILKILPDRPSTFNILKYFSANKSPRLFEIMSLSDVLTQITVCKVCEYIHEVGDFTFQSQDVAKALNLAFFEGRDYERAENDSDED